MIAEKVIAERDLGALLPESAVAGLHFVPAATLPAARFPPRRHRPRRIRMTQLLAFAKPQPLLTFFALTFAISWGGILISVGVDGLFGVSELDEARLPFVYLAMLAGPSAVADSRQRLRRRFSNRAV